MILIKCNKCCCTDGRLRVSKLCESCLSASGLLEGQNKSMSFGAVEERLLSLFKCSPACCKVLSSSESQIFVPKKPGFDPVLCYLWFLVIPEVLLCEIHAILRKTCCQIGPYTVTSSVMDLFFTNYLSEHRVQRMNNSNFIVAAPVHHAQSM